MEQSVSPKFDLDRVLADKAAFAQRFILDAKHLDTTVVLDDSYPEKPLLFLIDGPHSPVSFFKLDEAVILQSVGAWASACIDRTGNGQDIKMLRYK